MPRANARQGRKHVTAQARTGGDMKVVILAGGMGTRIAEESHLNPKPMIEIGGYPILWHIMKHYSRYGHHEFIICCGYRGYMIKEYFADYYLHHSDVTFDFGAGNHMEVHSNIAEPWRVTLIDTGLKTQTGGRIRRIQKYVADEPFLLTYGDGVGDVDLDALLERHRKSGKTATITAVQPGGRFGVIEISENDDLVTGFQEKTKEAGGWINAGFMVMQPEIFRYLPGDSSILERDLLERLSEEGRLNAYRHAGFWQCMDTQRDKGLLESCWNQGNAPWKTWPD